VKAKGLWVKNHFQKRRKRRRRTEAGRSKAHWMRYTDREMYWFWNIPLCKPSSLAKRKTNWIPLAFKQLFPTAQKTYCLSIIKSMLFKKFIVFYSKPNQVQNTSNLFYFGTTLYMFRMVSLSIIRSLRPYIQHHTIQVLWLQAATEPVWYDAVCTVLDSWWWTERPSETCRVLFQNKINLRYCASGWFYYRDVFG
jgi:hypothetical protein